MSKTDVCAGCGKVPVCQGRSRVARFARALGLCYTCYSTATIRKKRQKAIGWKAGRHGPPKAAAHLHKKSHHRRGNAEMSKTDLCTECRTAACGARAIGSHRAGISTYAKALKLCFTCYTDPTVRKRQQNALGLKRPGAVPDKAVAQPPDGVARAFGELGSVVEDELLKAASDLGDDITRLVASVRAAIARTFQQRKAMAELMTRLKKKANEAAADLRRRIKELEGSRRELGREISRLPTPEADAHAHGEETTT